LARNSRPDCVAQGGEPGIFGRQRGIGGELGFELDHDDSVKFAVEGGMEKHLILGSRVCHVWLPSLSICITRGRSSLDIPVPTGVPIATAIVPAQIMHSSEWRRSMPWSSS
jgi:hypothetical protein